MNSFLQNLVYPVGLTVLGVLGNKYYVGGQIKDEIKGVKTEMGDEIKGVKTEMGIRFDAVNVKFKDVKTDIKEDIKEHCKELKAELKEHTKEIKHDVRHLLANQIALQTAHEVCVGQKLVMDKQR